MGARELDFSRGPVKFTVEGISMSPGIKPGDVLLIYPLKGDPRKGDIVVAYDPSRGLKVLKRVAGFVHDPKRNEFLVKLESDHPEGRSLSVRREYVLGRVQSLTHSFDTLE